MTFRENEPGHEKEVALFALKSTVDSLMAAAENSSPAELETIRRSVEKLIPSATKPAETPSVRVTKIPETLRSPEELSAQLVQLYNELRGTASLEDLTNRITAELGPNTELKVENAVIFVRSDADESWFVLPNIGEKNIGGGIKRWYRVSDPASVDTGPRRVIDFRLDQLAGYPPDESPWDKATGDGAMHKRLGKLTETFKQR